MKLTCKILGHRWIIKGYRDAIDTNGKKIPFNAKRICASCEKTEYKYAEWIDESLTPEAHRNLEKL